MTDMTMTFDLMVERYVTLRDKLKEADDGHKAKTKAAREYLEKLNGQILAKLNEVGSDSTSTPHGTAYRTMRKSATIADGEAFRKFVIKGKLFDLVDWKANANAVSDFIDTNQAPPPGVNYSTTFLVGVRRK